MEEVPAEVPVFVANPHAGAMRSLVLSAVVLIVVGCLIIGLLDGDGWQTFGSALVTGGVLGYVLLLVQKRLDDSAVLQGRMDQITFAGSDMVGANFMHWHMIHQPYFSGRDLRYSNFASVTIGGDPVSKLRADFSFSNVSNASFIRAHFPVSPTFDHATCRHVNLTEARCRGALFRRSDCTGAWFARADLRDADFSGADVSGAVFDGADLRGVNLTGATTSGASFDGAQLDARTRSALQSA